jgi:hypothetical protein
MLGLMIAMAMENM